MKNSQQPVADWQTEVWRIKEELSADARRMGLREYVAFMEREARRILAGRIKPATAVVREKPSDSDVGA
jgi:hypothetical protein